MNMPSLPSSAIPGAGTNPDADEWTTRGRESPSLLLGPRRLHYQYSVSLPQLHMTLISVLQGLAFAVLLSRIPLVPSDPSTGVLAFLLQQHFFLPYVTSSLLILLIWLQFIYASMFVIWPVSTLQTALIYLLALAEIVTFQEIDQLPAWVAGLGFVAIVGGCIRLNNLRWQNQLDYVSPRPERTWRNAQIADGLLYIGLGVFYIALGISYPRIIAALAPVLPFGAQLDPWGVLVLTLVVLGISGARDTRFRQRFLRELTEGSDLTVSPHGTLCYRMPALTLSARAPATARAPRATG